MWYNGDATSVLPERCANTPRRGEKKVSFFRMNTIPYPPSNDNFTIYRLIDPRDGTVRYIGITISVFARFKQHLLRDGSNTRKDAWITELEHAQVLPIMDSIEHVTSLPEATLREMYWIQYYQESGTDLFNIANAAPRSTRSPRKTQGRKHEGIRGKTSEKHDWFTTTDAAKYVKVNKRTIEKLVKLGELPAAKVGKLIRIKPSDLDDFMYKNQVRG
jgi:excisionase family DNA binding protein